MTATNLQDMIDIWNIRELTAQYNRSVDDGDADGYANTFLPDGFLEMTGAPPIIGHEALTGFARSFGFGTIHMTTDAIVDVDGDQARQRCSVIVAMREKQRQNVILVTTARADDELVRTPAGWRFKKRTLASDVELSRIFARFSSGSAAYDAVLD